MQMGNTSLHRTDDKKGGYAAFFIFSISYKKNFRHIDIRIAEYVELQNEGTADDLSSAGLILFLRKSVIFMVS